MKRLTDTRRAILAAMATRNAPLILGLSGWFVREWSPRVADTDAHALIELGLVAVDPAFATRRVHTLTAAGRAVAETRRSAA